MISRRLVNIFDLGLIIFCFTGTVLYMLFNNIIFGSSPLLHEIDNIKTKKEKVSTTLTLLGMIAIVLIIVMIGTL